MPNGIGRQRAQLRGEAIRLQERAEFHPTFAGRDEEFADFHTIVPPPELPARCGSNDLHRRLPDVIERETIERGQKLRGQMQLRI